MAGWSIFDRTPRSPDDRGVVVPLLNIREMKRAEGPKSPRAALARHLHAAVVAESRRMSLRGLLRGLVFAGAWIGLQVFVGMTGLGSAPGVSLLAFWGGLAIVIALGRGSIRRRYAQQLAATAVAEGFCGSCGYSLESISAAPDGCVVCPECGAAWGALRVTRPHWDGARPRTVPQGAWWWRSITGTPSAAARLGPDDRGRFVPVLDSRLLSLPAERRLELGREVVRPLRRRLRRIGRIRRLLVASVLMAAAGLTAWGAVVTARERESLVAVWIVGGFSAVFLAGTVGMFLSHRFIHPRAAAREIVAFGLCGACGGSIGGLRAGTDGCVTCAGCGASWRRVAENSPSEPSPTDRGPSRCAIERSDSE